jgi:hypothetical protein
MANPFSFLFGPAPTKNLFAKSVNALPLKALVAGALTLGALTLAITCYFTPKYLNVGYTPEQPVPFSHAFHVGQLGLDCRYCHNGVEKSAISNVPSTNTCMNCHSAVKTTSPLLAPVRASYASGEPVKWVKVHKVPDYVYFNHSVHVNRGVSCVECHGRIDQMEVVGQAKPLSMGFCLDCHRNPEKAVRPLDKITDLAWTNPNQVKDGTKFVHDWKINPPQSCFGCHR